MTAVAVVLVAVFAVALAVYMSARPSSFAAVDGFAYWPACPTCGGPVGCYGRHPENAVPADVYDFRCNEHGHPSSFTRTDIMAMQARRKKEIGR